MSIGELKYLLLIGSIKPTRSAHKKRVRFRVKSCQHVSKISNDSLAPRHRASLKIMERSWIDPFSYHDIQGHGTRAIAKIDKFYLFTIKRSGPASLGLVWVTLTPFEW